MLLVGVGDGRVQHHRARQAVALDEDVAGGCRADGRAPRAGSPRRRSAAASSCSRTVRRTNSLGTATRRLARTAAGHGPAEVAGASTRSGWPARLQRLQVVEGEHGGRRSADRHGAAGVVDEVEGARSERRSQVDSAATRRQRDRPSIEATSVGARRHQLGVGAPRSAGSTNSRRSRSSDARSSRPAHAWRPSTARCHRPRRAPATAG